MEARSRRCPECGYEKFMTDSAAHCGCLSNGERIMTLTPGEARALNRSHRPRIAALGMEVRDLEPPAQTRKRTDPFEHVSGTSNYLYPSQHPSANIPRHRWPEGMTPERAALEPSSVDANTYESWRREQAMQIQTAVALAEKTHAEHEDNLSALRAKRPDMADPVVSGPSTAPPRSAREEHERAVAARNMLLSLRLGYELCVVPGESTFMRDAGGRPVNDGVIMYAITRGGLPVAYGPLMVVEQFAHSEARDKREQDAELESQARKTARPLVLVGSVQVVPDGEPFQSEAELEIDRRVAAALARRGLS